MADGIIGINPILPIDILVPKDSENATIRWRATLYASTTLIPCAVYLTVLYLFMIAKLLLSGIKTFSMYFIERATEVDDPKKLMVFTLGATILSTMALFLKLLFLIISTLYSKV